MCHAINVGLRHVEASHDYPWPPYIPGLFVAGAIIGPQGGGDKGGPTMAATIGPGGPAMADSHAINGPPGLTMAAIIGPQRGGLTMAGADQLWQPQSVRGGI